MKCVVLAGGKGNSLWPLSREQYPKQFMQIIENRSLFQETIARNIPFCEEFLIVTNADYYFIVKGQMQAFQGLKYRCILEEEGRKTGPAIAMACLCCNSSDVIFVVSADHIIDGENYKEAIILGEELARKGFLVTFGMEAKSSHTGYGYIRYRGEDVVSFHEKPNQETAEKYLQEGDYYWNSGNFLFIAGDFLQELRIHSEDIYYACVKGMRQLQSRKKIVKLSKERMLAIPAVSVENAVFEKSDHVKVVKSSFFWQDISDMAVLAANISKKSSERVIQEACENVTVINHAEQKLVVANHLKDVIIVNTEDATYVTTPSNTNEIKNIIRENQGKYGAYFEKNPVEYYPWGTREILNRSETYKVKKVTLYPGHSMEYHRHEKRSEQWSVVEGVATITIGTKTRNYETNDSVFFPEGVPHMLSNKTEKNVIVIEVATGQVMSEKDRENIGPGLSINPVTEEMIKCEPTFKDNLWGGTKLRDQFHKKCDYDVIAESWELSAHGDGQNTVAEGPYKGMLFDEYLKMIGEEALGWKSKAFERFPILIKFIDAKQTLSVQVHPDDEYALREEHEYGKNEMWYILDAEPGAGIYFGVNRDITSEELKQYVEEQRIEEVLSWKEVKKGETYFVEAGTIHAIGAGVLLCEIQQNSNCTYRLYDYGRRDKYGNLRELHLDKVMDVAKLERKLKSERYGGTSIKKEGYTIETLVTCKYFICEKYTIQTIAKIEVDETSFRAVVFLSGRGKIRVKDTEMSFVPGDTFFVHAGKKVILVNGECELLITHV